MEKWGPPEGKHLFGMVKVGEKGQVVIPKQAREIFGTKPGDQLMVLGDEQTGIALLSAEIFWKTVQGYAEQSPLPQKERAARLEELREAANKSGEDE